MLGVLPAQWGQYPAMQHYGRVRRADSGLRSLCVFRVCVCLCVCALKGVTQWVVRGGDAEDSGRPGSLTPVPPGWYCRWRCGWGGAPKLACSPRGTSGLDVRRRRRARGGLGCERDTTADKTTALLVWTSSSSVSDRLMSWDTCLKCCSYTKMITWFCMKCLLVCQKH